MINIIIPMNEKSLYETSEDHPSPKILTKIANKTIFEYSQQIFDTLEEEKNLLYVIPKVKLDKIRFDTMLPLVSNNTGKIVVSLGQTQGAICSALLAIDQINLEKELIIACADQYINANLHEILQDFRKQHTDAGILCFESIHSNGPSIKLNHKNDVIQTAEKNLLSRYAYAIADFYYFRKGSDFINAAKNTIRKNNSLRDYFYLSSCLNQLILLGKKVKYRLLASNVYHKFNDANSVKIFERQFNPEDTLFQIKKHTKDYVQAFHRKSLQQVMSYFDENARLTDPNYSLVGKEKIEAMLLNLFTQVKHLSFVAKDIILADERKSIIEFVLTLDDKKLQGVDIIVWNNREKIISLNAYLY